jgi:ferrous iron transport protein A
LAEAKSLLEYETGATLRVVKINAGRGLKQRLLALGLVPGADLFLVENRHGPVKLCFNSSRIAIGRGVAAKILASPATDEVCPECIVEETCPRK